MTKFEWRKQYSANVPGPTSHMSVVMFIESLC